MLVDFLHIAYYAKALHYIYIYGVVNNPLYNTHTRMYVYIYIYFFKIIINDGLKTIFVTTFQYINIITVTIKKIMHYRVNVYDALIH